MQRVLERELELELVPALAQGLERERERVPGRELVPALALGLERERVPGRVLELALVLVLALVSVSVSPQRPSRRERHAPHSLPRPQQNTRRCRALEY